MKALIILLTLFLFSCNEDIKTNMTNSRIIINNGKDTILMDKYGVMLDKVHSKCDIQFQTNIANIIIYDSQNDTVFTSDSLFIYKWGRVTTGHSHVKLDSVKVINEQTQREYYHDGTTSDFVPWSNFDTTTFVPFNKKVDSTWFKISSDTLKYRQ